MRLVRQQMQAAKQHATTKTTKKITKHNAKREIHKILIKIISALKIVGAAGKRNKTS